MGFVRTRGAEIVDSAGRPLLLRGVGLGNWLLPEGYMWKFGDGLASPRQIEARIERLVGPEAATDFWKRFRDVFIAEEDIARIAALGFDHVRLPINSRVVLGPSAADGFALIERAVEWCERHGLWILLDLHGAPGGQTGTNIDDSPNGKPELFMDERYRKQTVDLWREIARRYRDRTAVLGYDLLNEPLPEEWQYVYPRELMALYAELTAAIREVDPDHLIMYEGPQWSTDVSIFTEVLDPNSVLQFHRYWCAPERAAISDYLEARDRLGIPVYMGEGGENTAEWIYTATRLYEQHGIGWNLWPWKKLDTLTSPVSAPTPDGWSRIADPADDVDARTAQGILDAMLDNVALDRCVQRDDVLNALFARAPLHLPAWGYAEPDPAAPSRFAGHDPATLDAIWHHTAGEPYAEPLGIAAGPGQEFRFPLADQPRAWTIQASDPAAFDAEWSGGALVVRAKADGVLHSVQLAD
ncbi:glycoside hydrolase family 5 protein [Nucisporomicrobium flavum]|uniref:glycoside hydrolase family 5 protein n=1 Tax=Nucisporomicrobium flavum TaxID=2785915 RepID=UPI003C2CAA7B